MTETGDNEFVPISPARRRFLPPSRRTVFVLILTVVILVLVAGALIFNKVAPPRAARLLPESDGIIYIDAAPLRTAAHFDTHPVKHDPDYQTFIDATGIEFERDLNQAAFATHRMPNPLGPNGPIAFSSIFVGNFDRLRLASYLARISQSQEQYAGHVIYNIAVDGRTDRVVILDAHTVAVSNTPTMEQIHSILDRDRTSILPFSGNSLLTAHYKDVPLLSLAWGMGKLAAGLDPDDLKFFGFKIPLSVDATFIGSIRWAGTLRVRIEEIAPNGTAATLSADSIESLLSVARTAHSVLPGSISNPDTQALLDSVNIEHHNDRAILTATVPLGLIQRLTAASDDRPAP